MVVVLFSTPECMSKSIIWSEKMDSCKKSKSKRLGKLLTDILAGNIIDSPIKSA